MENECDMLVDETKIEREIEYKERGFLFDWKEVADEKGDWFTKFTRWWDDDGLIGILWIDGHTGMWALDILLDVRVKRGRIQVVTHELRPEKDNLGWDLNVGFVPKKGPVQLGKNDVVRKRCWWDCGIYKRKVSQIERLAANPFCFERRMRSLVVDGEEQQRNFGTRQPLCVSDPLQKEVKNRYGAVVSYNVFGVC